MYFRSLAAGAADVEENMISFYYRRTDFLVASTFSLRLSFFFGAKHEKKNQIEQHTWLLSHVDMSLVR